LFCPLLADGMSLPAYKQTNILPPSSHNVFLPRMGSHCSVSASVPEFSKRQTVVYMLSYQTASVMQCILFVKSRLVS